MPPKNLKALTTIQSLQQCSEVYSFSLVFNLRLFLSVLWCFSFVAFVVFLVFFLHSESALGHWPSGAGAAQKSGGSTTLPAGKDSIFYFEI